MALIKVTDTTKGLVDDNREMIRYHYGTISNFMNLAVRDRLRKEGVIIEGRSEVTKWRRQKRDKANRKRKNRATYYKNYYKLNREQILAKRLEKQPTKSIDDL